MYYGTYRMRMRAGRAAYPTLKTALPAHMAGAVEPYRASRANEFLVDLFQEARFRYVPPEQAEAGLDGPWDVDRFTAGYMNELRLRRQTDREPVSDGVRIMDRMRITRPHADPNPALHVAHGLFLAAFLVIFFGIVSFLMEPSASGLLAAMF